MDERRVHPVIRRLRERKRRHSERGRTSRFAFALAGFAVVALGVALLPLPGPGFLVIAVGLGLLALEFDWAERWLERSIGRIDDAQRAATASRKRQVATLALAMVGIAAGITAIVLWEIPFLPG